MLPHRLLGVLQRYVVLDRQLVVWLWLQLLLSFSLLFELFLQHQQNIDTI